MTFSTFAASPPPLRALLPRILTPCCFLFPFSFFLFYRPVLPPSPFPPLSVVGLLPPHCSPQHSCVPNVQLEAYLLPAMVTPAQREKDGRPRLSHGSGGGEQMLLTNCGDAASVSTGRESSSALRVGLVTLRGVRAGGELFSPYVALSQSVEDRRRELASRFHVDRRAGSNAAAAAAAANSVFCSCPRCLVDDGGDHRSCGREMLKVLPTRSSVLVTRWEGLIAYCSVP